MEQVPDKSKIVILVYFLIIAIDSISFGLIGPVLAPLLAKNSFFFSSSNSLWNYLCYGFLISIFPLAFMFSAPFLGTLSDRYGRKIVLLFCLLLTLVAFTGYSFAFYWRSLAMLIFSRLIAGICASSQGVAQAAVIDFAKQHDKPILISTIAIGMTMGLIIGPLAASMWKSTMIYLPFILVFFLIFFALCLLLILVPKGRSQNKIHQTSLKSFLKIPGIKKLLMIFLLFEMGWSMFFQSIPLFLSLKWNLKNPELGFVNSYVGLMLALCLFFGSRIGLRFFSLSHLIQFGFCFGVTSLILLSKDISLFYFLIFTFPLVLAVALIYPSLISNLSGLVSVKQQGLMMGLTDSLLALAFAITGMFSSLLMYSNPQWPFLIAAIFWILASIGMFQFKRRATCNYVST